MATGELHPMIISPELKDWLEALSYLATLIGIPIAILVFLYEKRKDRLLAEAETYLHANDKYIQYLTLCLEHPQLDAFDLSIDEPNVARTGIEIQKLTLFTILISTLETGFLLYQRHKQSPVRLAQWKGWQDYMVMWASREDFRRAWPALGPQFDADFYRFMSQLIHDTPELIRPNRALQPTGAATSDSVLESSTLPKVAREAEF